MPYFGVLIIRILLFRVLYRGPLFSETPIFVQLPEVGGHRFQPTAGWWLFQESCSTDDGGSFGSATGTGPGRHGSCNPVLFVRFLRESDSYSRGELRREAFSLR